MLEQDTQDYLNEALGTPVLVLPWDGSSKLAVFLTNRYRFARTEIGSRRLLLAIDEAYKPESPAVVRKHILQIEGKLSDPVVYVREGLSASHRQRLVAQKIPFIVPGNQMYLPDLGIDFREYFRSVVRRREKLRPASQAVLIEALLNPCATEFTAGDLASKLGYSPMTFSRAFDELEAAELIHSKKVKRERRCRFDGARKTVWDRAQEYLQSPVQSKHFIESLDDQGDLLLSGESALARYSQLRTPLARVTAADKQTWDKLVSTGSMVEVEWPSEQTVTVEIWKYQPRPGRYKNVVEPLSLSLAMRDSDDERVQYAVRSMLNDLPS